MHLTTVQTPRGPVDLRTTAAPDAAALRDLRLEALRSCPTAFGGHPDDACRQSDADWTQRAILGAGDGGQAIYVADHLGQLIGMTGIHRDANTKRAHSSTVWGVYVRPDFRRQGLAEALVRAALGWAEAKKLAIARLSVVTDNTRALACYHRCGFRIHGIDPGVLRIDGRFYDEVLMHRWLLPEPRP